MTLTYRSVIFNIPKPSEHFNKISLYRFSRAFHDAASGKIQGFLAYIKIYRVQANIEKLTIS